MIKSLFLRVIPLLVTLFLTGCDNAQSSPIEKNSGTTTAHQVIKVGTMGTYNPFTYIDENGQLTGFDLEVLREISRRDSSLQFEFIASPWDTLFPGLDADRFQLLANQISATTERKRRYLLTNHHYFNATSQFIISSERSDIRALSDLKGKKVGLTVGDAHTYHAEEWNQQQGGLFEIVYYESDLPSILQDIENGRIDATFNDPIVAADKAKRQGLKIAPVGQALVRVPTYFIVKNDEQGARLKQKIDIQLANMINDGWLPRLSKQWFGEDYTQ